MGVLGIQITSVSWKNTCKRKLKSASKLSRGPLAAGLNPKPNRPNPNPNQSPLPCPTPVPPETPGELARSLQFFMQWFEIKIILPV